MIGRRALLAGLMLGVSAGANAWAAPGSKLETVEIVTLRGRQRFQVEIAATRAQQERGLMFRKSLAPDHGMLFTYAKPQRVAYWMKNTLIPLDIIYIAPNGKILSIARNARPHDETPLASGGLVLGVLELAGGRAAQLGILPGDRVLHRIFPKG
jgi:uncharacterized membrane protein (UPF0127 family)